MKSILSTAVLAAALLFVGLGSAAEREIEIRCVVGGEHAPAAIQVAGGPRLYHVHDPAGTRKLGSLALRTTFGVAPWVERFVADDGPLALSTDPDPASAKNPEQLVGSFDIPAGAQSIVVLLIPRGPTLIGSHILAFDESAKTFPLGSIKFVNFSPEPIQWALGSKNRAKVAPKTAETMVLPPPQIAGAALPLSCDVRWKEVWRRLYAVSKPIVPNQREIEVVYELPGAPHLKVVAIAE